MAENFRHGMPEELAGWLYKKQRVFPTKKRRYFKLASQVLSSHVRNNSDPSWEQNLLGADVVGVEGARRIVVMCPDRTVRLITDTPNDYYHWLDALQKAANRRIEDYYELGQSLGEGAFAKVVMGLDRTTLEKFAVKIIEKQSDDELGQQFVWRELNVMKNVNHPNIVRTYDIFDTKNRLYIVLEYMPGGTLGEILKKVGRFTESQAKIILADILNGVAYLHDKSIVHRDLKLKNILCDTKEMPVRVKLADFGLANFVGVRTVSKVALKSQVGSPHYVAPEVLREEPYGPVVDTWAVGVILHIMLTRRYPFAGETIQETLELVVRGRFSLIGSEWDRISEDAKSLLQGLLREDPQERLTARDALSHPWFSDLKQLLAELKLKKNDNAV
ncbi:Myosin light chain kinase A [Gracilariopsis chorda]|uniref:Myosin light chain kinase A n=1 Tax=Gracilariopsis chorda TaxID=448386 RepID=A0A2V3II84_9FLOR|nr:Myosin light chain kinase A [Gracilariopsis chorda]|eukprot:PXF41769.1 Myosin light chain kinase A [Gracilariopsis chorda]